MPTPFPGMDPYLERSSIWPDVHLGLIRAMQVALTRALAPRYLVTVEERLYLAAFEPDAFLGRPDVAVVVGDPISAPPLVAGSSGVIEPMVVDVPLVDEVRERYLEVRDTGTGQVITVIELLSPSNKLAGDGREQYLRKREAVLGSQTHLVEIDLLRAGEPMPIYHGKAADYRVLVSPAQQRPHAYLYALRVRDPLPAIPIPLRGSDDAQVLDLGELLGRTYDEARYDLRIDYHQRAQPPLAPDVAEWAAARIAEWERARSALN